MGQTNNRNRDIHPCFVVFSGVEMVLWKAAKDYPCMKFSLDHHARDSSPVPFDNFFSLPP